MRRLILIIYIVASLLLRSCGISRHALPTQSDSTRVKVRTIRETVHDTAYIELPVYVERNVTKDTTSMLENPFAKSEATVTDGHLKHSLETKPIKHPVKIEKEIVYRDSIIYRDRTITQTIEVPAQLSSWQIFKMKAGGVTLTLLTIAIVTAALYLLLKSKTFLKL